MAEPTTNPFKNYFYMKSDWSRLLKGPSVKAHLVLGTAMVCSAALILKAASNPSGMSYPIHIQDFGTYTVFR